MFIYVGTATGKSDLGIYGCDFDTAAGRLGEPKLMAVVSNPSFIALTPAGDRLYAAVDGKKVDGKNVAGVAAFAVNAGSKALTLLNEQRSGDSGNCFVDVSSDGRFVGTADYGSARVDLLPLEADGTLKPSGWHATHTGRGPNVKRQEKAHAHCCKFDPSGRFAIVCDLGTDEVVVYKVDPAAATMARHHVFNSKPGSGPRHITFSRDRRFIYVANELSNTVAVLGWDAEAGTLSLKQELSTLPDDWRGQNTVSEVVVHPSNAFVYLANRGHDSVACFHVEPDGGRLSFASHTPVQGKNPRHINVEPNGRYLLACNQDSQNVPVFKIDPQTGALTATGGDAKIPTPMCVRFLN